MLKSLASFLILFLLNCLGGIVERGGRVREISISPQATIIRSNQYKILESSEGESSTFFLLGLIPVSPELNIEYALSQAVQKVSGGDSMVNINIWHETHYYFPLGTVSVVKVSGDVVSLKTEVPVFEEPKKGIKKK